MICWNARQVTVCCLKANRGNVDIKTIYMALAALIWRITIIVSVFMSTVRKVSYVWLVLSADQGTGM